MTLKTNDLIKILWQSPRPSKPMGFDLAALGFIIICLALTRLWLGLRPELMQFAPPNSFYIKTVILLGFALSSLAMIRQAASPTGKISPVLIFGMPLVLAILVASEWMHAPDKSQIMALFHMPNFNACLVHVTLYGLGGMVLLTWLMKQYAPKNENVGAAVIGFSAAAFGAVGYSIHCMIDSPTFIAVAYGIPVIALTLLGSIVLPRFIRW